MTSAVERLTRPDCPNPERQKEQQDAAFWQQWICYQDELYRDCLQYMRNPTEAEDLLSQAMLKAWQQITTCTTAIKNFRAWVKQLTKNLYLDFLRQGERKKVEGWEIEEIAPEGEWAKQGQNPVHDAMHRELENFFENAIDGLPTKLRETFVLYYQNDQSYPAILEPLPISYSTARKRISDARKILHQEWKDYLGGEDNPSLGSFNRSPTPQKTPPTPIQSEPAPPVDQPPKPVDRATEQHQTILEEVEAGDNISSPPLSVTTEQGAVPQISLVLPTAIGLDSTKGGGLKYKHLTQVDPTPVFPIGLSLTPVKFEPISRVWLLPVISVKIGIPKFLRGPFFSVIPIKAGLPKNLMVLSQPEINYHTLTRSLLESFQKQFELLWRVWMDSGDYCHLS